MKTPGVVFRASHVLVFFLIIAVLVLGIYVAFLSFSAYDTGVVEPSSRTLADPGS